MKVAATIPIKIRSTRVPGKNFRDLNGKPLYKHVINNCVLSNSFTEIYVDTDSSEIKEYCKSVNVETIDRIDTLARDTANGNDVLHYDIERIGHFDFYFQLFATAPFLKPETIKECVDKLTHSTKNDSIFTATEEYGWYWHRGQPVNYLPNVLPRSQDSEPLIKETTGLYGISHEAYNRYKCRIGACPYAHILKDPLEFIDLDTLKDFDHLYKLLR